MVHCHCCALIPCCKLAIHLFAYGHATLSGQLKPLTDYRYWLTQYLSRLLCPWTCGDTKGHSETTTTILQPVLW